MKILGIILGTFCLLISVFPCCIGEECESTSVEIISENDNNEHSDECGICSPFISCGTCTGFIAHISESLIPLVFQPIAISNLFDLSFKSAEAEYAMRVWQPPQLVIIS